VLGPGERRESRLGQAQRVGAALDFDMEVVGGEVEVGQVDPGGSGEHRAQFESRDRNGDVVLEAAFWMETADEDRWSN
jgi:hypothetical protein